MSSLDFGTPASNGGTGTGTNLNFGGGGTNLDFGGGGGSIPTWARPPTAKGFFASHIPLVGHALDLGTMEGGRFASDLENAAIGTVTGSYQLAHDALAPGYHPSWGELGHQWGQFLHDPLSVFDAQAQAHDALNRDITAMYHQTVKSMTPHEILVHPGNAFLSGLLLAGGIGGVAGRGGEISRIARTGGELPKSLTTAMDKIRPAYPEASDYQLALKLGRADEYTRAVHYKTGVKQSVGSQIYDALVYGLPEKQRLLYDSPMKLEDWLLEDPTRMPQQGWKYSKNLSIRGSQMLIDQLHRRFPDSVPPIQRFWFGHSQAQRISSAARQSRVIENNTERLAGKELLRKWGGADNARQMAVRLIAEGTLPEDAIAAGQRALASGVLNERMTREMERRIATIEEAKPLMATESHLYPGRDATATEPAIMPRTHTVPVSADEQLSKMVEDYRGLSNKRTTASRIAGVLSHESMIAREVGPLNYLRYGEIPERLVRLRRALAVREGRAGRGDLTADQLTRNQEAINKLRTRIARAEGTLSEEEKTNMPRGGEIPVAGHEAEWLAQAANLFRVPYEVEKDRPFYGAFSFRKAYRGRGGQPPPSTYTHPFKAGVLAHGGGDLNTAKLIAESYTEAHRYIAFQNFAKRLYAEGSETPEKIPPQFRVLMKDPEFRSGFRALPYQAAENQAFDLKKTAQQAKQYEAVRAEHFPRIQEFLQGVKGFSQEQINRLITSEGEGQYRRVHGYRWVDSRKLGGLNKQNPLISVMDVRGVRNVIHFFDLVNAAQKMAILYLKPAYAIPNMLGNAFLNLIQQGPLAPYNMALSVAAHRFMDVETRQRIRGVMGEGASDVLRPQGLHGWASYLSNKFAAGYGKFVDDPFRFSSFLYEARASGFRSLGDLYNLTHDPELSDQFRAIGNRANDAVINYELLSPGEQAMARRVIFFYPWVKGSTRYATQIMKEHPTAAGALGIAGIYGTNRLAQAFPGGLPPWAEGSIVYSPPNQQGYATVGNPAAAAILQEPADLLRTAIGLFQKNPDASAGIFHQLAPGDEALLALGTQGQYSSIPHPAGQRPWDVALNEAFGGNPLYRLIDFMIHGPNQTGLYPDPNKWHALSRWGLLGSLSPRQIDAYKAAEEAYRAANVTGYVGG